MKITKTFERDELLDPLDLTHYVAVSEGNQRYYIRHYAPSPRSTTDVVHVYLLTENQHEKSTANQTGWLHTDFLLKEGFLAHITSIFNFKLKFENSSNIARFSTVEAAIDWIMAECEEQLAQLMEANLEKALGEDSEVG